MVACKALASSARLGIGSSLPFLQVSRQPSVPALELSCLCALLSQCPFSSAMCRQSLTWLAVLWWHHMQATDGCDGWISCNDKTGCGSGCSSAFKLMSASSNGSRQDSQVSFRSTALPLTGFGGCVGDKWPFGMCTLKSMKRVTVTPCVLAVGEHDGLLQYIYMVSLIMHNAQY